LILFLSWSNKEICRYWSSVIRTSLGRDSSRASGLTSICLAMRAFLCAEAEGLLDGAGARERALLGPIVVTMALDAVAAHARPWCVALLAQLDARHKDIAGRRAVFRRMALLAVEHAVRFVIEDAVRKPAGARAELRERPLVDVRRRVQRHLRRTARGLDRRAALTPSRRVEQRLRPTPPLLAHPP